MSIIVSTDVQLDLFLNGKVKLYQNTKTYKATSDAVLLASSVSSVGKRILDLGSGVGLAALCTLFRYAEATVYGLEKQIIFYELALRNAQQNSALGEFIPILGNVLYYRSEQPYDVIICNPPYFKNTENIQTSQLDSKQQAKMESDATLKDFVQCAFLNLKDKGDFYIINNSQYLQETITLLEKNKWGAIEVFPIYSYINDSASRFIIKAKKLSKANSILHFGIIMHKENGHYTEHAEKILRHGGSFLQK